MKLTSRTPATPKASASRMGALFALLGAAGFSACARGDSPAENDNLAGPAAIPDIGVRGDGGFGIDGTPDGGDISGDPKTCAEAEASHSYIGCDYWPTVVGNYVWSIFDYAVVVANAGDIVANVTVTGPYGTNVSESVPPGELRTIYLPWVAELKGPDWNPCTLFASGLPASVYAPKSAFHLVSDAPVSVYQFNALEYVGAGGPPGKSWESCIGSKSCGGGRSVGCYSFTNDASLLLPTSALTGNYRITGHEGDLQMGMYFAITATQDDTTVVVNVSKSGVVVQEGTGERIPETYQGGTLTLHMNAGDVAELTAPGSKSDLSGSLVKASAPVQVITGVPCMVIPDGAPACDHMEESNLPAETFGKDYVVTQPPGPNGDVVGHQVRFFGNFDDTTLSYDPAAPPGCPTHLQAGQVIECPIVNQDFEVKGDKAFAVATFTQGASIVDPHTEVPHQKGDPAQSLPTAVEQFRTKYVFLAPHDYDVSYVEIISRVFSKELGKPIAPSVIIDGATVTEPVARIGSSEWGIRRVKLGDGKGGAHVLTASEPVGIQVVGYGSYTSYMYPGGLNLGKIAPPPIR